VKRFGGKRRVDGQNKVLGQIGQADWRARTGRKNGAGLRANLARKQGRDFQGGWVLPFAELVLGDWDCMLKTRFGVEMFWDPLPVYHAHRAISAAFGFGPEYAVPASNPVPAEDGAAGDFAEPNHRQCPEFYL